MISKFREKILKSSEAVVHELFYWLFGLDIQEKPPKNVSAPETCSVTTHGPYHAVSLMQFSENLKKATPQSHKKSWWKMENIEWKHHIKWKYLLPDPKVAFEEILQKKGKFVSSIW